MRIGNALLVLLDGGYAENYRTENSDLVSHS